MISCTTIIQWGLSGNIVGCVVICVWNLGPFRLESLRETGKDALIIDDPQVANVVANFLLTTRRWRLQHCKIEKNK
jgi:hypothetical protein